MIKYCGYFLCLILIIQHPQSVLAQAPRFVTLNYHILSEGVHVGEVIFKLFRTKKGYVIVEYSHIKTAGWWGDIDLVIVLSEAFQYELGLILTDSKTWDNDTMYWSRIEAHENSFLGKLTEVSKMNVREKQRFFQLSSIITKQGWIDREEVALLSNSIFSARNDLVFSRSVPFVQDSFDTSIRGLPFWIQKYTGKALPQKIRILDIESFDVIHVDIKDLGLKTIMVGLKEIEVRHLILSGEELKPLHLWIKIELASLPYIVRYTGEDEEGRFEIILTSLENE